MKFFFQVPTPSQNMRYFRKKNPIPEAIQDKAHSVIENKTLLFRLAEEGTQPLHLICSYSGYQWLIRKQDTIILRQKEFCDYILN